MRLIVCAFLWLLLMAAKKEAPASLALRDTGGQRVQLSDYRGKVVVLNFWATWCGPCREEMPMLTEAARDWESKGVVFVAASLDEKSTRKSVPEFAGKYGIRFPVWLGATADDLERLGMGEAVPDTAFVDERGFIFARVRGQMRREELDERLRWITEGRKLPAPRPLIVHLP
jgi:thiol-disulfide isomerase/thioredoxin